MSSMATAHAIGDRVGKSDGTDGILAQTCYDWGMARGLVRAAERAKSPAILQLFPVTLAYGQGPFLQYCLDL